MRRLNEGLEYKDMVGMMKPTLHVDEFSSKMGDDEDIVVVSFFVRDEQAAKDLVSWFESGYDSVLDADRSPGEIKPNRYLVYIELRRRSTVGERLAEIIDDLGTLTEFDSEDWRMKYRDQEYAWSRENFDRVVPLSPQKYREEREKSLNEWREAAGLEPHPTIDDRDPALGALQHAAGIR
jgi:hypothetical protein